MCEFYGATEGTVVTTCNQNKVGAIGWVPAVMRPFVPFRIVRFDVETETPVRVNGRCVECAPGEPGEMLGQLVAGDPAREFQGYTNAAANDKKVLTDVFRAGDRWFRTGDLLVRTPWPPSPTALP